MERQRKELLRQSKDMERYAQAKMRHVMQWKSYEQIGTAEAKPRIERNWHRQSNDGEICIGNGESYSGTQRNRYEKK